MLSQLLFCRDLLCLFFPCLSVSTRGILIINKKNEGFSQGTETRYYLFQSRRNLLICIFFNNSLSPSTSTLSAVTWFSTAQLFCDDSIWERDGASARCLAIALTDWSVIAVTVRICVRIEFRGSRSQWNRSSRNGRIISWRPLHQLSSCCSDFVWTESDDMQSLCLSFTQAKLARRTFIVVNGTVARAIYLPLLTFPCTVNWYTRRTRSTQNTHVLNEKEKKFCDKKRRC